jgi:hypothetical protein
LGGLVLELTMELSPGPRGKPAPKLRGAWRTVQGTGPSPLLRKFREILEGEGRPMLSGDLHEVLGEDMKARKDSIALPPALTVQELTADASVVRLLPGELASAVDMSLLEYSDLWERYRDRAGGLGGDADPIEGALVGVEAEEGARDVRGRGRDLVAENDPLGGEVELFPAKTGRGEN